jgi:hypothetical protein
MAKTLAELKADLAAAKAKAAKATKKYQNTKSYAENYAEIKAANDGAIRDVNKLQDAIDAATPKPKKTAKPKAESGLKAPADANESELSRISQQLGQAQNDAGAAELTMAGLSSTNPVYQEAKVKREAALAQVAEYQNQINAIQSKQESVDTSAEITKLQDKLTKAKDLGKDTTSIQSKIDELSGKKVEADKRASTTTPGGAPEVRYGPNGESLVPGTAAYAAGSTTKPVEKKTVAGGKPAVDSKGKPVNIAQLPAISAADKKKAAEAASGSTDTTTGKDFLDKYGVQAGLVNSDPSLQKLFKDAMAGNWDAKKFQAEFLNTSWAKNHSSTWQAAETARLSSPGEYANSYNRMRDYLARTAVAMGESISPEQLGAEIKPDANGNYPTVAPKDSDLVQWALAQSWGKGIDAAAIQQHLAQVGKINLALPGGEAANVMSQLKSIANDYGLNSLNVPGSNYFSEAAQSILLGKSTVDTWKQDIVNTAKQNYKPYAAQLDAGITLKSIASPYINTIANLLEIPPDTVDLSQATGYGKMVSNALMGSDPANPVSMTLSQFEQQVKQDPRWAMTNNARDTVMGGVGGLLKMLGKVS